MLRPLRGERSQRHLVVTVDCACLPFLRPSPLPTPACSLLGLDLVSSCSVSSTPTAWSSGSHPHISHPGGTWGFHSDWGTQLAFLAGARHTGHPVVWGWGKAGLSLVQNFTKGCSSL